MLGIAELGSCNETQASVAPRMGAWIETLLGIEKPLFLAALWTSLDFIGLGSGGDEGDRTPGLDIANVALSQLSYIPNLKNYC